MQAAPRDDPDDIDRVSALLAQVLEAPLASQPDVLAALCAEHQDCALALQQAYESLQRLDLVQVAQSKDEGGPGTVLGGLPRTLGPFRLLEFLGAGGMGAVYRAEDEELKRPVALKLVRSELLASPRTRSRFQRESAALARLDHPGLCTAYRAGSTDGQPWIAMRLVRGTTLAQGIEARRAGQSRQGSGVATMRRSSHTRRDLRHTLLLFEKIARALATAHAVGVVHRDIKPGNIVLTSEDEPVVIDFGLVHLEDSDSHLTMSGDHIGTPAYMAPEQVDAAGRDVAPTTDIYALGVTLFEALTLESPYQARSREELYHCILRGKRRRLRQVLRSLPADLEMVLEKALDLEPARRYASMVEFADDLRRYLAHEPLMAGPPSGWYRLRKLVRRNPGQVMAGSAVFVTAVVGAVVALQFALGEQAKVREFDLLSGVVLYDNAIAAEKELYPPWPHKIAAMEHWLQDDAGRVLAMKEDIERTVRDLEARALPQTEAERDADRRSHPKLAALDLLTKRVTSLRYAQAIREGKAQLVLPVLTAEQQALGFDALFVMAWPRVDPGQADRTIWGEEPLGLALARAAAAKAHGTDAEYKVLDLLAWALLANGQDAEAKARSEEALGNAPDIEQEAYLGHQRNLDAEVAQAATILSTAEKERDDLATVLNERHTFRFELESQRFLHYTLAELLAKIGSLASKQVREVDMRVAWARQIQGLSLAHPKARHTWAAVRAAIAAADDVVASKRYSGSGIELGDRDITGLVPIGMNPATKLWEFYELRSACDGEVDPLEIEIPQHDPETGVIEVKGETGIVFVLVPGGTFTMGAQKRDEDKPNYDPWAEGDEIPHEVTLAPFFVARHELTQGQWARLWYGDESLRWPSIARVGGNYRGMPVTVGPSHPVESVDWTMCDTLLRRSGLLLPTEAQWEFACRAGESTPWYTGQLSTSLAGHANVLDRDGSKHYPAWGVGESFDDGFAGLAPVNHYPGTNAFGLYGVHGNVSEWCRDGFGSYGAPCQAGDGMRLVANADLGRVRRGGAYMNPAEFARSANRMREGPSVRSGALGLRPVRSIRPID